MVMEHPAIMMMKALTERKKEMEEDLPAPKSLPIQARKLLDVLPCVLRSNPFQVGDLVQQIKGLAAYKYPGDGEIAIITGIMPPKRGPGEDNNHLREDIIALCLCRSTSGRSDWVEFSFESWRFEKYEGEIEW
jgi:hypothetical protein